MRHILNIFVIIIIMCVACSKSDNIIDNGNWTRIYSFNDSLVKNTYALIDGKIYYGGFDRRFYDSVLCSEPASDRPYLKQVDLKSFEICENSCYARDAHHVYAPLQIEFVDGEEYGGYYAVEYIIENANPRKFKYIRNDYAISGNHMYYEGKEISWRSDVLNCSIPITNDFILQNNYK